MYRNKWDILELQHRHEVFQKTDTSTTSSRAEWFWLGFGTQWDRKSCCGIRFHPNFYLPGHVDAMVCNSQQHLSLLPPPPPQPLSVDSCRVFPPAPGDLRPI
uniref:Uncharacterized protein n=1 Tax=Mesocestoides corti TaxID=53468 RepID=A0A5K3ER50_MESCO